MIQLLEEEEVGRGVNENLRNKIKKIMYLGRKENESFNIKKDTAVKLKQDTCGAIVAKTEEK